MVTDTTEKKVFNKFYKGNPILHAQPAGGGKVRVVMVTAVAGERRVQHLLTPREWEQDVEQREVESRKVAYLRSLVRNN